jgi:uncharacterized protein YraI
VKESMMKKIAPLVLAALLGLASAGAANAASGLTTAAVNLRIGPGTGHAVLAAVPAGQPVTIIGCISGYAWCDVVWGSYRGWMSAAYVTHLATGTPLTIVSAQVRVPTVSPWVDARRDARVDYRVERRMDRRWDRWTGE